MKVLAALPLLVAAAVAPAVAHAQWQGAAIRAYPYVYAFGAGQVRCGGCAIRYGQTVYNNRGAIVGYVAGMGGPFQYQTTPQVYGGYYSYPQSGGPYSTPPYAVYHPYGPAPAGPQGYTFRPR